MALPASPVRPYGPRVMVRRLAPLDALFLAAETPAHRLHVMAIIVLDPSTVPGGYSFERLREHIADRLHVVPPLRQRLVRVPFGLDLPVWVEAPDVDVEIHVRRATLGVHVDAARLSAFAASLDESPLDPDRPLWEMHVVEGLDDGNIAVVAKLHHALMDGMAGMSFMASLFSFAPVAPDPPERASEPVERPPASLALVARALPSFARLPVQIARVALGALLAIPRTGRLLAGTPGPLPNPLAAPHTRLNDVASGRRAVAYVSLPLDEVRAVKDAYGVTLNDVVLAIVSGALRAYLAQRGELPDQPLAAAIPVALPGAEREGEGANAISLMFTSLPTDVDEPADRVRAAHEAARAAKRLHEAIGPELLPGLSGVVPPFALETASRLYSAVLASRLPVACHTLISNVAGPPVPMYFGGAHVVALHPLGPLFPGIGCNVTVVSCEASIGLGVVVCPDAVPDVADLAQGFSDELAQLTKSIRASEPAWPPASTELRVPAVTM